MMQEPTILINSRTLEVILLRKSKREGQVDGEIYIGGEKICDCVENQSSLLVAGRYGVSYATCRQHGRKMLKVNGGGDCARCPRLWMVDNNTKMPQRCPMITAGNGVCGLDDGRIIVGRRLVPGFLIRPERTLVPIRERIRRHIERGGTVELIVL